MGRFELAASLSWLSRGPWAVGSGERREGRGQSGQWGVGSGE